MQSSPVRRVRPVLDKPGGYDEVLLGYEPVAQVSEALVAALDAACASTEPAVVAVELAKLKAATVGRQMEQANIEAWIEVGIEDLAEFPLDVIKTACRKLRRREKWMPAVAEIREECNQLVQRRRWLREAAQGKR